MKDLSISFSGIAKHSALNSDFSKVKWRKGN